MDSLDSFKCLRPLKVGSKTYAYYSLPAAEKNGLKGISRLPFSLKVLLENLLRNEDGRSVAKEDIQAIALWLKTKTSERELAFRPARVLMQDFTGVPAVVDLAAMRDAMEHLGGDPKKINPLVPVDLVIDHSVAVNFFAHRDSFKKNVEEEYKQNQERYRFLKWAQSSFEDFRVVPPGTGICHQVNLEYLAHTVWTAKAKIQFSDKDKTVATELAYPDTLVGTDSHTTMVNGLSVLGWGVGGIEAEAAMLGQPYSMLLPEVIGVRLNGKLKEGVTATDLVLTVTQMLRKRGVVGKFVEYFGPGLANLSIADRATIGNMSPEYGATCGFFPIDDDTIRYLRDTGRPADLIALVIAYAKAQGMYRTKNTPDPVFTDVLKLELGSVEPSLAGPKRPQDRIALKEVKSGFAQSMDKEFNKSSEMDKRVPVEGPRLHARQRRRRHRGDHLVHQHVQPERDDGCRPAGQEGGGKGADGQALGQDFARARVASGRGILSRSRGCRNISTRSASIWSVSAAPPASAIPARCRKKFPKRSTRTTWWLPRCCPAIAISKAASTPTCAPTTSLRRRSSSPMRSPARCRSTSPRRRSAPIRRAARSICATSGRPAARSRP